MKASGLKTLKFEKVTEGIFGLMVVVMKDISRLVKLQVMVDLSMRTETFM